MRQLTIGDVDTLLKINRARRGGLSAYLADLLARFANQLGVTVKQLHLDHDPALENRRQLFRNPGSTTPHGYVPDANDPNFLLYRIGGFRGSDHDIKTRVRGERGQFADNVIAKRARRRAKKIDTSDIPEVKEAWFKRAKIKWPKGRKLQGRNDLRRRK